MLPNMKDPDSPFLRPKTFTRWYALDYLSRPRSWPVVMWSLLGLAVVATTAWLAYAGWAGRQVFQSGPVSPGHAPHADDCGRCHVDWFRPAGRLLGVAVRSVPDSACAACHAGHAAAPVHRKDAPEQNCAVCHREHRDCPDLTVMSDLRCTACHEKPRLANGSVSRVEKVAAFPGSHPDFGVLRRQEKDPAQLHFNHAVHLGLRRGGPYRGIEGPLDKLQADGCGFCHVSDRAGRYVQPVVRYQEHCAPCHPLAIQVCATAPDPETQAALEQFRRQPAPHVEPEKVRAEIRQRLARLARQHPALLSPPPASPARPFPGKAPPGPQKRDESAWVDRQLETAEYALFAAAGGCGFCHVPESGGSLARPGELPKYAPTQIRSRWFTEGVFSHKAHARPLLECRACHPAATSRATSDVLLPGIPKCQECHTPGGSARSDCRECHRYHEVR
jgi:hypothetical protein